MEWLRDSAHTVSVLGVKGVPNEAELRPKLKLAPFQVVELDSPTLGDEKSQSGGLHDR